MRSLELSLTSKLKCISRLPKKPYNSYRISNHHSQLYSNLFKSFSSNSNFFVGEGTNAIAKIVSFLDKAKSFVLGTQIHGHVVKLGFTNDTYVQNNLIKMYTRNGFFSDGLKVFDEISNRNIFSWTLIISGVVHNEEFELGLEMYLDMTRSGSMPNEFTLGSVLKGCANVGASGFGLCIHSFALKIGMDMNPFVGCSILNFYVSLGDIDMVERLFDRMDCFDTGCWNAVIGGYAQCGYGSDAVNIVSTMRYKGINMDNYTFINALQGCSAVGDVNIGRQIHGLIIRNEVEADTSVMNALMDTYNKIGGKDFALKVFQRIANTDIVSWNTVFGGFSQYEDLKKVASLFNKFMQTGTRPNHITFSILFRQCGELLDLNLGHQFHCLALKFGLFGGPCILNSLINMFSRCGAMEMAHSALDSKLSKDISGWNELISGYMWNGCNAEALQSFCTLWKSGVEANEYTFSSILEACFGSGNQQMGRQIHSTIVKSGFASNGCVCGSLIRAYVYFGILDDSFEFLNGLERLDIKSWGNMISALVHQGYNNEAISFLPSMLEEGMKPDEYIFGSIVNSCSAVAAYSQTISIHPFIVKLGFEARVFVASALIDAYAKCGDIKNARMVFDQSTKFNDVVIYNAMIMAYAHHGLVMEAVEIFQKIKLANLQPSQATFVAVISACSHKGLIDQGCFFFELMKLEYGIEPNPHIYGSLVDMFSRNGCLEFSKSVIESMPFHPWPAILRSLLSGCRIHGNLELGKWAAQTLHHLDPENNAACILASKIYLDWGSWEDAARVRRKMIGRVASKNHGCSWIET